MRDILLILIVFGLLPFILRRPLVGAYTWAWLSMMSPQKSVYGFARSLPFAYVVALATMIGLLFTRHRRPLPVNGITVTLFLLLAWMTVTSFFSMNASSIVLDRWVFVMKIQVMIFVTLMLIRGREQIDWLIWVVTMSVGFYGIKGGIWTLMTGGAGRVWGPSGGMIEGNNELAVALIMLLPLMFYLHQTASRRIVRLGLLVSMLSTSFAILGSQSRGAVLGLCAMALYLAIKSKAPIRMAIVLGVVLAAAISFMPDTWSGRMDTIQSYELEGSAISRIYAWRTMWAAAIDRPWVGVGFGADNPIVFLRYAPHDAVFESLGGAVFVAHSIYLQVLGEHGFPAFVLFLLLGIVTWRTAGRLARQTRDDEEFGRWVPELMHMVQVSLVGYAVGGAFLSLAYFDLPYYVMSFVVLVDATVKERNRSRALERSSAPAGLPSAVRLSPIVREGSS